MGLEKLISKRIPMNSKIKPIAPEMLVPRLGDYLVEKGLVTRDQLKTALAVQKSTPDLERSRLIGQILIDLNFIDRATLDQAITEQILQLRNALEESNRKLERRVKERTLELEEALNKLSELDKLKSNFVSNISHELRTPMTHLKGYLELLTSGDLGSLNMEQENALSVMNRSANRLEQLIEDLILFSTTEHSNLKLNLAPTSPLMLIETVIKKSNEKAIQKQITLTYHAAENLPNIWADENKITWVLFQLLDNAIKFTPNHGTVSITLELSGNQLRFKVIDTGIGIPEDRIAEIFEPFHQLDSSSTRRFGGTGLGLTLVDKIIKAHQSHIEVRSSPGVGSSFEFSLNII